MTRKLPLCASPENSGRCYRLLQPDERKSLIDKVLMSCVSAFLSKRPRAQHFCAIGYTCFRLSELQMATATQQKTLGAFYTADPIARFLVNWAVRSADDIVLDPSCGDGVFLSAARERILLLGNPAPAVSGIDINSAALQSARLRSPGSYLLQADFFSLKPGDIPLVSAVVGNPPFIRYQTFNGGQRAQALRRSLEMGVRLPQLCSSWAPFLVHATAFLRPAGRLGMVAPAELVHAQYAREVLRFLLRKFKRITVRMFQKKMFAELSEDTVLLLCEDFGEHCDWFSVTPAASIEDARADDRDAVPVDIEAVRSGKHRLTRYLLPPRARHLYEALPAEPGVVRLGDAADVGIGYVTGCNDYFHLTFNQAKAWQIPSRYLLPAVLSLGDFHGTTFRRSDWRRLVDSGGKSYLLNVSPSNPEELPHGLSEYLRHGKVRRVHQHFKCRVRPTWYSVPHVRVGNAFLSYMSGASPKLVSNRGGFVAPNTLHVVRFASGYQWKPFAAGWYSSFTRLSCELEGHPLGGGMLKLEPSEAENVLIALPYPKDSAKLVRELDCLLRRKDFSAAIDLADCSVLRSRFGLSNSECMTLRDAARQMETWRMHK
jgi:adenine-specific DNA-methyltransferase